MSSPKVVIIGAGIAGLCAAVYARKCGYQVEIIEQHDNAGGLATSWRRGDYTFETCLHWFTGSNPKGALHAQWREVFDVDKLRFVYPEEQGWLLMPGMEFKPLRNTLPGLRRFLMAGQWVMPGGGLPSGLMTARLAVRTLCNEDRIPFLPATVAFNRAV
jgi:phytoene dehydrogenase-like protein